MEKLSLPDVVNRHMQVPFRLKPDQPADQARFVVFDAEMTGLGEEDRLLSLGAVRIEASRLDLAGSFYEILDPSREIPAESIKIHHIVPNMAEGRPDAATVLPRFLDFIGSNILVAHNARFDKEFLNREMLRLFGAPLQSPIIDVMLMSRTNSHLRKKYSLPGALEDHTLDGLAREYGISIEDRHLAFGDALATGLIFLRIMKGLQRFGIYRVKHLLKIAGL